MNETIEKVKMWVMNNKPIAIGAAAIGGIFLLFKLKQKADLKRRRRLSAAKARRAKKRKSRRR